MSTDAKLGRVVVFGLRCSGTNYLSELVTQNYPNVEVQEGTLGVWKHMWQAEKAIDKAKVLELAAQPTLYLFVARNVIEWLQSFHKQPHHCLWAKRMTLQQLLEAKPFVSHHGRRMLETYPSILQERSLKHRHIVESILPLLPNAALVQYEQVRDNPAVLQEILERFAITRDKPIVNVNYYKKEKTKHYAPKVYSPISHHTMEFIIKHADWEIEKHWGYQKATN